MLPALERPAFHGAARILELPVSKLPTFLKPTNFLISFFSQGEGEFGFAGFGGVVEGGGFAIAFGGAEEESLLGIIGQADEAGFAVGAGSDFEVEFVEIHEAVGDVDADVGGIDWGAGGIGDGEVGRARADGSVDDGDGFGVDLGICFGALGRGGVRLERGQGK